MKVEPLPTALSTSIAPPCALTMPCATAGIADEEAFAHVPGVGEEAPFRRDDGQAFAAGGFAGKRWDDPRGRDDAGSNVLEKFASGFHLGQSGGYLALTNARP